MKRNVSPLMIRKKNTRKTFQGYSFTARWKNFSPDFDTKEPLHSAAECHKQQLLSYLMGNKEDTKDVVNYIRMENKLGLFTEEFKKEMDGLLLGATAEV